jgi:hypothetical protein
MMLEILETAERRGARFALREAESRLQDLHLSLVLASEIAMATGVVMALKTIRVLCKDQTLKGENDGDRFAASHAGCPEGADRQEGEHR